MSANDEIIPTKKCQPCDFYDWQKKFWRYLEHHEATFVEQIIASIVASVITVLLLTM